MQSEDGDSLEIEDEVPDTVDLNQEREDNLRDIGDLNQVLHPIEEIPLVGNSKPSPCMCDDFFFSLSLLENQGSTGA